MDAPDVMTQPTRCCGGGGGVAAASTAAAARCACSAARRLSAAARSSSRATTDGMSSVAEAEAWFGGWGGGGLVARAEGWGEAAVAHGVLPSATRSPSLPTRIHTHKIAHKLTSASATPHSLYWPSRAASLPATRSKRARFALSRPQPSPAAAQRHHCMREGASCMPGRRSRFFGANGGRGGGR